MKCEAMGLRAFKAAAARKEKLERSGFQESGERVLVLV